MKRTFPTTVALAAFFGLAACKGGSAEPLNLVPDQATLIGAVNVKGLMNSQLYKDNKDKLESGESKEMMEAAKACNLDPNGFDKIVFGVDPDSESVVFSVAANGVGKIENLECIGGKIKEKSGEDPWTVEEKDGKKTLSIDGGEAIGIPVSDNLLVVTSKGWESAVRELIAGKGKAAATGSLKAELDKAPKDKQIWIAGKVPADAAAGLKGTPGEKVSAIYGGIDLSNGLAVSAGGVTDSAESAKKIQEELQKTFDQFKGMAAPMGVPQAVIDSVKIEAADTDVKVALSASAEDLKAIQEKVAGTLGPMMGGGMGGSAGGPPPGMGAPPPGMGAPPAAPAGGAAPAAAGGAAPAAGEAPSGHGAPPAPSGHGAPAKPAGH